MVALQQALAMATTSIGLVAASAAPTATDSPAGASAVAAFPEGGSHSVRGSVSFSSDNGKVQVHVDVSGLPESGAPFLYHIHKLPVPSNGSCLATSDHLNPYNASTKCDKSSPSTCEIGDLAGKWGTFNGTSFTTTYDDPYLSLDPESESFIAKDRSIVFHFHNTSRIACANLKYTSGSKNSTNNNTLSTLTYLGGASGNLAYGSAALAGLVGIAQLLF